MQTLPKSRDGLLLTFEEYCARITPEERQAYYDRLDKGAEDFGPINDRLDVLNDAIDDGWCPTRDVKYELKHLNDVISPYHIGKYPNETRQTLDDAETDLAIWQVAVSFDQLVGAQDEVRRDIQADFLCGLWTMLRPTTAHHQGRSARLKGRSHRSCSIVRMNSGGEINTGSFGFGRLNCLGGCDSLLIGFNHVCICFVGFIRD